MAVKNKTKKPKSISQIREKEITVKDVSLLEEFDELCANENKLFEDEDLSTKLIMELFKTVKKKQFTQASDDNCTNEENTSEEEYHNNQELCFEFKNTIFEIKSALVELQSQLIVKKDELETTKHMEIEKLKSELSAQNLVIQNLKKENNKLRHQNMACKLQMQGNEELWDDHSFAHSGYCKVSCQEHLANREGNNLTEKHVRASIQSIDEKIFDPKLSSTFTWVSGSDESFMFQHHGLDNQSCTDADSNEVFGNCEDETIRPYPNMTDQDQYSVREDYSVDLTVKFDELKDVRIKKRLKLSVSSCISLDDDTILDSNITLSCDDTIATILL